MASKRTESKANTQSEQPKTNMTPAAAKHVIKTAIDDTLNQAATRPPCTPDQLTSLCHACDQVDTCSYLLNQTTALPGDSAYVGVA